MAETPKSELKCAICTARANGILKKTNGLTQYWISLCGNCYKSGNFRDLQTEKRVESPQEKLISSTLSRLFEEKNEHKRRHKRQ